MLQPRNVPNRDDYYMGLAFIAAAKSKDPSTQVSCHIVSAEGKPLGFGYNGPPSNIDDNDIDWNRPHKYPYIVHAEDNAIRHSQGDLKGATIYITARPCSHCMLDIVGAKIKRVVYFPYHKYVGNNGSMIGADIEAQTLTETIAAKGGVIFEEFAGNINWVRERIDVLVKMGIFG